MSARTQENIAASAPKFQQFGRESSHLRRSLLLPSLQLDHTASFSRSIKGKSYVLRNTLKNTKHFAGPNGAFKLTTLRNGIIKYQGVSLYFLTQFWNDIKCEKRFPGVHLYRKTNPDGSEIILKSPQDTEGLQLIKREDWTVQHLIENGLTSSPAREEGVNPQRPVPIQMAVKTFLDEVEPVHRGKEFQGMYLVYDDQNKFSEIVAALQTYSREQELINFDTFIFLKFLSMDLNKVNMANHPTAPDDSCRRIYNKMLRNDLPDAIKKFDLRLIFVENWEKPQLLTSLIPIWETYNVFSFEDKPVSLISNDYESIHDKVWQNEDGGLFSMIEELDRSSLKSSSENIKNVIGRHCKDLPQRFKTLRDTIAKGFTRWLALEADESVNLYLDIKAEASYVKLCTLLLIAGSFTYRRGNYLVAKSYFSQAVTMYEHFKVESYLQNVKGDWRDDLERPLELTDEFIHKLLRGLVTSRLGLAKTAQKLLYNERAFELIEKACSAAARLKNRGPVPELTECEYVKGQCYAESNQPDLAIQSYQPVELTWKVDISKRQEVTKINFELGMQYTKVKNFKEAQASLQAAYERHLAFLGENNLPQDGFLVDIVLALGDVLRRTKQHQKALETLNEALRIVHTAIGTCNDRAARINFFLGSCHANLKEFELALSYFNRVIEIKSECQGDNSIDVAVAYDYQAKVYHFQQDIHKAKEGYKNALRAAEAIDDPAICKRQHALIATLCEKMGTFLKSQKEYEEADTFFTRAFKINKRDLGKDHQQTLRVQKLQRENQELLPY